MEAYRGNESVTPLILTSALDGRYLCKSRPGRLRLRKQKQYLMYRRLSGSQSRFGRWGKEKNLLPKRSLLFWNVTQRPLVFCYRSFGTNYWYHLQRSSSPRLLLWHQQTLHFYGTRIYCVRKRLPLVIPCQLHPVLILTHYSPYPPMVSPPCRGGGACEFQ